MLPDVKRVVLVFSLFLLGCVTVGAAGPPLEEVLPCDTWVALPDATRSGHTILAKNSDRPLFDCQPLLFHPRKTWPAGATVNVGRVEIPQVRETYATLGSSPYWCWGYEEGINEHGVAIGNEGIRTRTLAEDSATHAKGEGPPFGPTGMDLLRLGLERGATAREALDVITKLLEDHGQFGSGLPTMPEVLGGYENSYIIADSEEAWVLETTGRRWVARRFPKGTTSISNTLTIGSSFDLASADLVDHAIAKGWWPKEKKDAFDFTKAYLDDAGDRGAVNIRSRTRESCSKRLLMEQQGEVTTRWMMRIARDRSSSPSIDLDQTASSCVAVLPKGADAIPVFWWCPSVPSSSCYVPFFIQGSRLPAIVSTGGTVAKESAWPSKVEADRFAENSYWWLFRDLSNKVRVSYAKRSAVVRAAFDPLEKAFEAGLPGILEQAAKLRRSGKGEEAAGVLDAYTAACVERVLVKVNELRARFESEVASVPNRYQPFVGKYHATIKAETVTVVVQDDHLALELPAQGIFQLEDPDDEGKWFFALTNQVAITFDRDDIGIVVGMKLHQAGLAFELIRDGVEVPPEIDLEDAKKYLGKYRSAKSETEVRVFLQNNRLAIDWPARGAIFELHVPNDDGVRAFRLGNTSSVRFGEGEDGAIRSLVYLRDGKVDDELARVGDVGDPE